LRHYVERFCLVPDVVRWQTFGCLSFQVRITLAAMPLSSTDAFNLARLESDLWEAADQLRANSKLSATEYSMPVLGLIFLRHATTRFDAVRLEIDASLPKRGGVTRPITKDDFRG